MAIDKVDLDFTRRSFLKVGVAGSVLLGTAGIGTALSGCGRSEQASAQGYRFLRDADLELLTVVMPVMLAGLPLDAQTGTAALHVLDGLLVRAGAPAQGELRKLFDLLSFGPTRGLTTGVWRSWSEASTEDVERFLRRWRESSFGMFNAGYRALAKLSITPYFGLPAGCKAAGYPGPPDWMVKAVNA